MEFFKHENIIKIRSGNEPLCAWAAVEPSSRGTEEQFDDDDLSAADVHVCKGCIFIKIVFKIDIFDDKSTANTRRIKKFCSFKKVHQY